MHNVQKTPWPVVQFHMSWNGKVQFDHKKHFQGPPILKRHLVHGNVLLCYENELWMSYIIKWKSTTWPWKIFNEGHNKVQLKHFEGDPLLKGIWSIIKCSCPMKMSLECHMPWTWNEKSAISPWKNTFKVTHFRKGILPKVRCSYAMNMSLLYIVSGSRLRMAQGTTSIGWPWRYRSRSFMSQGDWSLSSVYLFII